MFIKIGRDCGMAFSILGCRSGSSGHATIEELELGCNLDLST
jgi:hypothetical protein